ncbi:MAG: CARDB domain-containing protein [Thermoproteota archaeon]
MKRNNFLCLFFIISISTTLFSSDITYASPPWLVVGFYAKYSIVNADFSYFENFTKFVLKKGFPYANGTLFWKVEKIEGNYALIKINISIVGGYYDWKDNFSRTFHLLVDVNSRFILNTTKEDPFYFTYWIPIGTKEGEKMFLGHYKLMNSWLVGNFSNCYRELQVKTNWKNFYGDDLIYLMTKNETSTRNPLPGSSTRIPPVFEFLYDKKTGILVAFDGDPLLVRFLNVMLNAQPLLGGLEGDIEEAHFTNGTVKIRKVKHYVIIDSVGVEPVYESSRNESPKINEIHSVLISSFVAPSSIETGKDFDLSATIFNNGTIDEKDLYVQLHSSNESIKFLSSKEFLIKSIRPQEAKEVKWKIRLPSEGSYTLELIIVKNNTTLFQRTFLIYAESSLVQKLIPFIISSFLVLILLLWLAVSKSRKRVKLGHE